MICSQFHYCGGASDCPDCPSKRKTSTLYTSVLLPSGKNRKIKFNGNSSQLDLFGGAA